MSHSGCRARARRCITRAARRCRRRQASASRRMRSATGGRWRRSTPARSLTAAIARTGSTADAIASGTNIDDLSDFRPGLRAAKERDVVHPYVDAGIDKATIYAIAAALGLDDLERLPAQPCLSSRVETGIAIDESDLAFIDAVETQLADRLGRERVLRCRVTHAGIVIELADWRDERATTLAREIAERACGTSKRRFAGIRPYARGAAFIRATADD